MILRHRDRELLRFEWTGARGVRVLSVNDAERKFLPIEMAGTVSDESLWKWLSHRVAPISRTNMQALLLKQGLDPKDTRHVLELCRALSLNDVYWIAGDKSKKTWADVNLYENPFSKTVSFLALTGEGSVSARGWLSFPGGVTGEMRERLKKLIGFRFAPHHTHNLSVRRDSLLAAIIENIRADSYATQEELCDILEVTRSVLTKAMARLQAEGKLLRVGSRKTGYWQVKD